MIHIVVVKTSPIYNDGTFDSAPWPELMRNSGEEKERERKSGGGDDSVSYFHNCSFNLRSDEWESKFILSIMVLVRDFHP